MRILLTGKTRHSMAQAFRADPRSEGLRVETVEDPALAYIRYSGSPDPVRVIESVDSIGAVRRMGNEMDRTSGLPRWRGRIVVISGNEQRVVDSLLNEATNH